MHWPSEKAARVSLSFVLGVSGVNGEGKMLSGLEYIRQGTRQDDV